MQTISFPPFAQTKHVFWFVLTLQLSSYSLFSQVLWQVGVLGFNGEKKFQLMQKFMHLVRAWQIEGFEHKLP
jgi:hypothetical protein